MIRKMVMLKGMVRMFNSYDRLVVLRCIMVRLVLVKWCVVMVEELLELSI